MRSENGRAEYVIVALETMCGTLGGCLSLVRITERTWNARIVQFSVGMFENYHQWLRDEKWKRIEIVL